MPAVVFTTAFSQYAVEAFGLAATDYLLKPFSDERFFDALARAKRRVRDHRLVELAQQMARVTAELHPDDANEASPQGPRRYLQRLSLRLEGRSIVLLTKEIVWIEAQDYCVMIHSTRGAISCAPR